MANQTAAAEPFLNRTGVTLVELMVVVMLLGTGILVAIFSFGGIQKSIQYSKGRTLATNIAQEKMQIVMQKSYYEVLVTTTPQFLVEPSTTVIYDLGYFPPEIIPEGGMNFTRYTYIQVAREDSGVIVPLPPTTPDTGMRLITVTVVWNTDSGDRLLSIQNVLNNPNTVMSNSILQGFVRDFTSLAPIPNSLVNAAENVGWRDTSSATGSYLINLSPGTFDFQASAPGYYSQIVPLTLAANAATPYNFALKAISSGTIRGTAWIDNHPVISQVVGSTGPSNGIEYVELYNPTTNAILMGSNLTVNTPNVWPILWDYNNVASPRHLRYTSAGNSIIPSYGYYLISNTGTGGDPATGCAPLTISGVVKTPDACWLHVTSNNHAIQCNASPCPTNGTSGSPDAGGVSIGNAVSVAGVLVDMANWPANRIDSVGWAESGAGNPAPTNAVEGTRIQAIFGGGIGLPQGEQFVRKMDTATISGAFGRAYDANRNNTDFAEIGGISVPPFNSATTLPPLTGTPAEGAIVSVTDGLSTPSSATLTGSPPYAQFTVPGIATGTWIVFIDSSSTSGEMDNVLVLTNLTTPAYNTILTTSGVVGMISGKVTDALGLVIAGGISVTAGNTGITTNASGMYFLRLSTGIYNVIANPGNANSLYASMTYSPPVTVSPGDVTGTINFQLPRGGKINGWISRDGLNPLPGVTVVAFDASNIPRDSEISGANGQFLLMNLTTGPYTVQPTLDPKETAAPVSVLTTVTAGITTWSSTFTVIGAMGQVTGAVTVGGQSIKSGVLIVASTAAIPSPLPALSSATLTGAIFYADSSLESGVFNMDVRGSTTALYNMVGFYTTMSGVTPVTSTRTISGVTVTAGQTTYGVNFAW